MHAALLCVLLELLLSDTTGIIDGADLLVEAGIGCVFGEAALGDVLAMRLLVLLVQLACAVGRGRSVPNSSVLAELKAGVQLALLAPLLLSCACLRIRCGIELPGRRRVGGVGGAAGAALSGETNFGVAGGERALVLDRLGGQGVAGDGTGALGDYGGVGVLDLEITSAFALWKPPCFFGVTRQLCRATS